MTDKLVSLAYHAEAGLLAAGTREGRAVIWRRMSGAPADAPEKGWQPLPPVAVSLTLPLALTLTLRDGSLCRPWR